MGLLGQGALLGLGFIIPLAIGTGLAWWLGRSHAYLGLSFMGIALLLGSIATIPINQWVHQIAWFEQYRALVFYRLPSIEMTELEFYSWWPMKLILGLFVLNMIWATFRRIEFCFLNIGVLTVHTGIVILTIGSILYGKAKVEGDMILWRKDLGGKAENIFYDATTPAIYFTHKDMNLMLELPELPRYNDHPPEAGTFTLPLHERTEFKQVLGNQLRATIGGFLAYGELVSDWMSHPQAPVNPAIRVGITSNPDDDKATLHEQVLIGSIPSKRVINQQLWSVEFLVSPHKQRMADLTEPFEGAHGLVVEIPHKKFRKVYPIKPNQTITLDDTGYSITVDDLGPYGMSIVTPGYKGASDTRAMLSITDGKRTFRRLAMHRYPKLTQDFVPAPDNPSVGPMGQRQAPSTDIKITYLDRSVSQFWIIQPDLTKQDLTLTACLPGQKPLTVPFAHDRFPVAILGTQSIWLQLIERLPHARRTLKAVITPKSKRKPNEEGTYLHGLIPIDLEIDLPGQTTPWRQRVWLAHMRYPNPEYAEGFNRPVTVHVPTLGKVEISFSRQRITLPFSLTLNEFDMIPYPGSTIPRDFYSDLTITQPDGSTSTGQAHLNNPLVHQGMKLSQTGWDPGNPKDPRNKARNDQGKFTNQQRYSILGVGNNVGIHIIFMGSCLIVVGIPWAFYVKPMLIQRKKRLIQQQIALEKTG